MSRFRRALPGTAMAVAAAGGGLLIAAAGTVPAAAQARAALPGPAVVPCSSSALVSAINQANSARSATLLLSPGCTYELGAAATADDGLPPVTGNLLILGTGGTTIRRSSDTPAAFRIFDVAAGGRLTLVNLTVANGQLLNVVGQGGAGIRDEGTLVLRQVRLTGNTSGEAIGSGLFVDVNARATVSGSELDGNVSGGVGGAISSRGNLIIDRSTLTGNTAQDGGGIFALPGSTTRISRTVITHNHAQAGGGIANQGAMVLSGDRVTANQAMILGGGIFNTSPGTVSLRFTLVTANSPDNCSPQGTIRGCRN